MIRAAVFAAIAVFAAFHLPDGGVVSVLAAVCVALSAAVVVIEARRRGDHGRAGLRAVLALLALTVGATALTGCGPEPVQVWSPFTGQPGAKCQVGLTLGLVGVITTAGASGVVGAVAWSALGVDSTFTLADCLNDAQHEYAPFGVQFTCDGGRSTWWVTFGRFQDVADYMTFTHCFAVGAGGGGGGGGGGGW